MGTVHAWLWRSAECGRLGRVQGVQAGTPFHVKLSVPAALKMPHVCV